MRRTSKAVTGTGAWDATYHYYLNQDSQIETRNGSGQTVKVQVWGLQYIDELVQQAVNSSPGTQSTCDTLYWACQDANWNVLGVTGSTGTLVERYEYTPYGQRTVFFSPGANDTGCFAPTLTSRRVVTSGSVTQPYGLCDFGHQGLMQDEETGLIYNRARYLAPALRRPLQCDPLGYIDSLNLNEYEHSNPITHRDSTGLRDQQEMTEDQYWQTWLADHPGLTPQQYADAKEALNRGCIGITVLGLGRPNGLPNPDSSNCYKTFDQAKKRQKDMLIARCDGQGDGKNKCNSPRVFSIHFFDNKNPYNPAADGKVDMTPWNYQAAPGYVNFDYAFYDQGSWWHANHMAPGMNVFSDDLAHWSVSGNDANAPSGGAWVGYRDFNHEVFCVACQGKW